MATAVIRTGGKQYRVTEGDTVKVEKLSGAPGDKVEFGEVLFLDPSSSGSQAGAAEEVAAEKSAAPKFGRPTVEGAKVEGEIVAQDRHKKIVVFKFQRRKKHRVKQGHRQDYTAVKITSIAG